MTVISQTTLSNAFPWMKMLELRLKFYWSLFLRGPINNIPALVLIMAWGRPGDKLLSEPIMVRLLTHICVTRPQIVKMVLINTMRDAKHLVSDTKAFSKEWTQCQHPFSARLLLVGYTFHRAPANYTVQNLRHKECKLHLLYQMILIPKYLFKVENTGICWSNKGLWLGYWELPISLLQ